METTKAASRQASLGPILRRLTDLHRYPRNNHHRSALARLVTTRANHLRNAKYPRIDLPYLNENWHHPVFSEHVKKIVGHHRSVIPVTGISYHLSASAFDSDPTTSSSLPIKVAQKILDPLLTKHDSVILVVPPRCTCHNSTLHILRQYTLKICT